MSKRETADFSKDGHSFFIKDLQELGYTPEGVVNWIALMGWSYDDHTEFFTLSDLIEKFNLEHLNPSPAAINFSKLDHFNGLHIRSFSDEELTLRITPYFEQAGLKVDHQKLVKIAPIIKERITTLDDSVDMAGFFFRDDVKINKEELIGKGLTVEQTKQILLDSRQILSKVDMKPELSEPPMRDYVEGSGFSAGQVFGVLRVAVTGQKVSPPLFESMEIIGKVKVLERIDDSIRLMD